MIWQPHPRLEAVLVTVLETPPKEREAVLARECAGDATLRREVESLLAQDDGPAGSEGDGASILRGAPIGTAMAEALVAAAQAGALGSDAKGDYAVGATVDDYTIVGSVGAGGFGVVFLALQDPPEERLVALKILRERGETARFDEERTALARLDHPGVARIYSGGSTERGHPYFAMRSETGTLSIT